MERDDPAASLTGRGRVTAKHAESDSQEGQEDNRRRFREEQLYGARNRHVHDAAGRTCTYASCLEGAGQKEGLGREGLDQNPGQLRK